MSDSPVPNHQLQRVVVEPGQIQAHQVNFSPAQRHYLHRVLRLRICDRILVMNGVGQTWLAALNPDGAELLEVFHSQSELAIAIHLWIALPKGNGIEEVIRQATEVGVAEIHPLLSDRTLLQPRENKLQRWRRIAQEAAEQSERQQVLAIAEPVAVREAGFWNLHVPHRYIAVTREGAPHFLNLLSAQHPDQQSPAAIWIATGPEGGWSPEELQLAIASGVECMSLGPRILRAVTAPIVAATLVAAMWEAGEKDSP